MHALVRPVAVRTAGLVDGVRSARRGRPDREGLLVRLLSAATFGVATSLVAAPGIVVTEGIAAAPPLGPVLGTAFTWASFVAVPAAVAYGLTRSLTGRRLSRRA